MREQGAMDDADLDRILMTFLAIPTITFLPVFAKIVFRAERDDLYVVPGRERPWFYYGRTDGGGAGGHHNKGRVALRTLMALGRV